MIMYYYYYHYILLLLLIIIMRIIFLFFLLLQLYIVFISDNNRSQWCRPQNHQNVLSPTKRKIQTCVMLGFGSHIARPRFELDRLHRSHRAVCSAALEATWWERRMGGNNMGNPGRPVGSYSLLLSCLLLAILGYKMI
jgi:hypothetical protein